MEEAHHTLVRTVAWHHVKALKQVVKVHDVTERGALLRHQDVDGSDAGGTAHGRHNVRVGIPNVTVTREATEPIGRDGLYGIPALPAELFGGQVNFQRVVGVEVLPEGDDGTIDLGLIRPVVKVRNRQAPALRRVQLIKTIKATTVFKASLMAGQVAIIRKRDQNR